MTTSLLGSLFVYCLLPSIAIAGSAGEAVFKNGFELPANMLVFIQAPDTLIAGTDPNQEDNFVVQRQDQQGNPVSIDLLTVTVTTNSNLGRFAKSDIGPFTKTSIDLSMAEGENSVQFYYKDSIIGTSTITAVSTLPVNGTHEVEIIPP